MSRLTPSNAKETPVLFQELVRLSEHAKIQEENENFSHAVTGLNPSSWIDFLFQLSRAGLHTYATSTGKLCFSKPNQSIWNLAQERHWLTQGPTSQHKVVSSAPSYPPTLGVSLLNHSNGRRKQSLKFTSPLSDVSTMSTSKHQKFLQCSKRTFHPCMYVPVYWTPLSKQQLRKCLIPLVEGLESLGHSWALYLLVQRRHTGLGEWELFSEENKNKKVEMFLKKLHLDAVWGPHFLITAQSWQISTFNPPDGLGDRRKSNPLKLIFTACRRYV